MNLEYAVDRLYQAGWLPWGDSDLERLSDGRWYPSLATVHRHFAEMELDLSITHNQLFNCYRATWHPRGQHPSSAVLNDPRHGTVVGACEREAAVYALAQLQSIKSQGQLAGV